LVHGVVDVMLIFSFHLFWYCIMTGVGGGGVGVAGGVSGM
jgi:hypothetical protein